MTGSVIFRPSFSCYLNIGEKYVYFTKNYMAGRPSLRLKITAIARASQMLKYKIYSHNIYSHIIIVNKHA